MASRVTTSRTYVDLDWGQVHCRIATAHGDAPLLLMLHQSPLSSRNYAAALPLLAAACRPVAIDTPGFGGSDAPPREWEVADYVAMVGAIADRFGARRFHLFGRATGAVFAFAAALAMPQRIASLTLHGMPVYTDAERTERLAGFAPPYRLADDGAHLAWIWSRIRGEYPWIDGRLATQFVGDYLAAGPDFASSYRAIWRYDLRAAARRGLDVPIQLIGGGGDRIGYMHARAVELLPRAHAVLLDDATDFIAQQDPPRFARILVDFIASHAS